MEEPGTQVFANYGRNAKITAKGRQGMSGRQKR